MSVLGQVGIPGSEHLREALTNCSDPLAAIEEFQIQNGILLPSLRPSLSFLDLHDIKRLTFHQSIVEELRSRLISAIASQQLSQKTLHELLAKSFPLIRVKPLRPIPMAIMKCLPKIKAEYLKQVCEDKELYEEVAIEVKQQLWQDQPQMFGDQVSPLFSQFIADKEKQLNPQSTMNCLKNPPKMRRQASVIVKLTKMVGHNIVLYSTLLQFIRRLFLRTRNIHYCTLRAELLMSLHDAEVHHICSVDPAYKFSWCLDACVREELVDSKRLRELQELLSTPPGQDQQHVLGDLAMIVADPHAVYTIVLTVIDIMANLIQTESLPRSSEEIIFLCRLLALGLDAWTIVDAQMEKEAKQDENHIIALLPMFMTIMIQDQLNSFSTKSQDNTTVSSESVLEVMSAALQADPVANMLLLFYCIHCIRRADCMASCRCLNLMALADLELICQDIYLNCILSSLLHSVQLFSSPVFCDVLFNNFLTLNISREQVGTMAVHLLSMVYQKIQVETLRTIMQSFKNACLNEPVIKEKYDTVEKAIEEYLKDSKQ